MSSVLQDVAKRRVSRRTAAMPPIDDPDAMPSTPADRRAAAHLDVLDQVVRLPLDKIHRNPLNRDPREADVIELMQSLDADGLQEPVVVRPAPEGRDDVPIGHYELISGETRSIAARRLGWDTIPARIRSGLSDASALKELAVSNAHRRNLDAIERARLLERLIAPEDQGGAGMAAAEAGRIYGLESDSGVRNAIQLLKLPEVWQQRVVSGEMSETSARQLVPYAGCGPVLKALDKEFRRPQAWSRDRWTSRDGVKWLLGQTVEDLTRPVEKGATHPYGYQRGGDHPRYFPLTPELEQRLELVALPLGPQGKLVRRALNVRLYDELQQPLIAQKLDARKARGGAPSKATGNSAGDEKRKRKEQDDQVAQRVFEWRQRFLRLAIAETIRPGAAKTALLLPLVCHAAGQNTTSYHRAPLNEFLMAAFRHNACDVARRREKPQCDPCASDAALLNALGPYLDASDDDVDEIEHVQHLMVRYLLWPQCGEIHEDDDQRVLSAGTPDVLPPIDHHTVEAIAAYVGADLRAAWQRGAIHGSYQRPLVEAFFHLHYRWQLDDLAAELLGGPFDAKAGKQQAVAWLMENHSGKHTVKLPKSVELVANAKKTRRSG